MLYILKNFRVSRLSNSKVMTMFKKTVFKDHLAPGPNFPKSRPSTPLLFSKHFRTLALTVRAVRWSLSPGVLKLGAAHGTGCRGTLGFVWQGCLDRKCLRTPASTKYSVKSAIRVINAFKSFLVCFVSVTCCSLTCYIHTSGIANKPVLELNYE